MYKVKTTLMALLAAVAMSACAQDREADGEVAGDTSAMMTSDSTMQMGHNTAAKDADHEFLRMMSDHHEGLVLIATQAMDKGAADATKTDAHELHTKQAAERDTMVAMISRDYQEQHKPTVMMKNQAQADSLSALTGAEYDRTFYRVVIDHHREGIGMIDQHLPGLTKPEVKTMAEKMKTDQQKEIAEFEVKAK